MHCIVMALSSLVFVSVVEGRSHTVLYSNVVLFDDVVQLTEANMVWYILYCLFVI